jgi:Beta-glucosidase-related glycosidases
MKLRSILLFSIVAFYLVAQNSPKKISPQLTPYTIKEVVKAMTIEEKVNMLVGNGFKLPEDTFQTVVGMTQEGVPGAAGTTNANLRLGIPFIILADGPAGVRIDTVRENQPGKTYYATAWPVAISLASIWDVNTVKQVGTLMGKEAKEYGIDILLAPALNIQRNPLGGRNFEYYSEDPLISGRITSAMVNGIQSNGVGTSVKHFIANEQEKNRFTSNTIVSERALREIYLKPFEIAVKESNPWTVMSAYNQVNGQYASESPELLKTILRDEWGFKGFVMTDWFAGKTPVKQVEAQNNLLMPGMASQAEQILKAAKSGKLSEKVLDRNISDLLSIILKSPSYKRYKYSNSPDLISHSQVARSTAAEGMVLLKNNEQTLPITTSNSRVALFGNNSYDLITGGTGSGKVNCAYTISLVQGLTNGGFILDKELEQKYVDHIKDYNTTHPKKHFLKEYLNPTPPAPEYSIEKNVILEKAQKYDVAIFSIGKKLGEGNDGKPERDFYLSDEEKRAIQEVSNAFHAQHKKMIVVLNIGSAIDVAQWKDYADAILLTWQPGQEGGNSIVDVLTGKVNPSGKLPITFPVSYNDVPTKKDYPGKEHPDSIIKTIVTKGPYTEAIYEEGIYVGYRYYSTFNVKPVYEFGYGLSYTKFDFSELRLSSTRFNSKISAKVTITNTGKVAGKEVVQLYITAPEKTMDKPREELRAFEKTRLLQPGESQTITFDLKSSDLASFNVNQSAWIADAGTYTVKVGASSDDIKQEKSFTLANDLIVEKVHKVLVPQVPVNELESK